MSLTPSLLTSSDKEVGIEVAAKPCGNGVCEGTVTELSWDFSELLLITRGSTEGGGCLGASMAPSKDATLSRKCWAFL